MNAKVIVQVVAHTKFVTLRERFGMSDQTRWRIPEVISENHAKRYENETRKKFQTWLEDCPVMFANRETDDPNFVQYIFNLQRRRK